MNTNVLLSDVFLIFGAGVLTLPKSSWPAKWRHLRRRVSLTFFALSLVCACFLLARYIHNKPFFDAVREGNTGIVKQLLSKNPTLIRATTIGISEDDTALHLAVAATNNEMVKLLLDEGADVNAKDTGEITPLHDAAVNGDELIAETLLKAGANVNAAGGRQKDTALQIAAYRGHLGVVKVLLAHGANIYAVDTLGRTALQIALEQHHTNVAAVLSK